MNGDGVPPMPKTIDPAVPAVSGNGARQAKRNPNVLLAKPCGDAVDAAEESFISDRELATDTHRLGRMKIRKETWELQHFFDARDQARLNKRLEEDSGNPLRLRRPGPMPPPGDAVEKGGSI
jgi:hypothetical protein